MAGYLDTTIVRNKLSILPVPTLGYSPETSIYFGGVSLISKKIAKGERASNAKIELNYSLKKQIIAEIGWNIFTKNETLNLRGNIQRRNFPDLYYGVSEFKYAPEPIVYDSKRVGAHISVSRMIHKYTFTGIVIRYGEYWDIVPQSTLPLHKELYANKFYGIGPSVIYDSRSNLLNPKSGYYGEVTLTYNKGLKQDYNKIIADFRYYYLMRNGWNISTRVYHEYNTATAPFFDMALMGGDQLIRGYYLGIYRSKGLFILQTEVRGYLYNRIGAAFFGGIGLPYWETSSVYSLYLKPNIGTGLRYLIDKDSDINLRIDFAHSINDGSGFYIAFGESF